MAIWKAHFPCFSYTLCLHALLCCCSLYLSLCWPSKTPKNTPKHQKWPTMGFPRKQAPATQHACIYIYIYICHLFDLNSQLHLAKRIAGIQKRVSLKEHFANDMVLSTSPLQPTSNSASCVGRSWVLLGDSHIHIAWASRYL